uniref:Cytochrome P450 n=1 Tax=Glossina palpalis gambiensis TaxID=67801 RepID=A0A1B0B4H8_9MUSC
MFYTLLITLLVIMCLAAYLKLKNIYSYWSKMGVPHEKPLFFLGNMKGVGYTYHWTEINRRVYTKFKDSSPIAGLYIFLTKAVIVMDLDLIKNILIKDFQYFSDRGIFHNERDDPLTGNLLFLDGDAWRVLRQKISPVFTSGKVKFMFSTIVKVAERLEQACDNIVTKGENEVETKDLCARFTTDVIGECGFGIECNSLEEPRAEFREMGRNVFERPRHSMLIQTFMFTNPDLARQLRMKHFRNDTSEFFMRVVKETIKLRQDNQIKRNDFMDLLIELMEKREKLLKQGQLIEDDDMASGLTYEQVCAQAMVFFLAGFDTSSAAMAFCLYELALNLDIQRKLREEILAVLEKYNSQITYESLKEMTYLEQVFNETLRKYPVVPHLARVCLKDYCLPNSDVILEKGLRIIIPIDAIHNDPEYFKEPDKFNPDRFSSAAIAQQHHALSFIPFGEGPRNCIGMRFGKLQAQIGLIMMLRKFQFSTTSKTKIPLRYFKKIPFRVFVIRRILLTYRIAFDSTFFEPKSGYFRLPQKLVLTYAYISSLREPLCTETYSKKRSSSIKHSVWSHKFCLKMLQKLLIPADCFPQTEYSEEDSFQVMQFLVAGKDFSLVAIMFITLFITLVVVVCLAAYLKLKNIYSYWSKLGVPHEKPLFFLGNMKGLGHNYHWTDINRRIYRKFKDSSPIAGLYTFLDKAVIVMDLDLIKNILIKDFKYFTDRGIFHNERDDPLTGNLLFLDGHAWRVLRQAISPVLTSGKVKSMFSTIVKVAERLKQACDIIVDNGADHVEVEDLCARFTTDVIGECAFGIECNSLEEPRAEFREMGRNIFEQPRHSLLVQSFMLSNPNLARRLRMKAFRRNTSEFFMRVVKETIKFRQDNHIKRNDFMDLLIELMEKREKLLKQGQRIRVGDLVSGLTFEQACAQAMAFFLAGFDTSSATMSFCLYELALNLDIQRKLREEIITVLEKYNSQITYESLKEMTYLEQVFNETLRKYPVVPLLARVCGQDYCLPNSDLILEKGLRIIIPIDAIHNDPEYFKEPDKFNPDRFSSAAMAQQHPAFSFLPFGEGPRNCFGMVFGKLQTQIGLVMMLRKFHFPSGTLLGWQSYETSSIRRLRLVCSMYSVAGVTLGWLCWIEREADQASFMDLPPCRCPRTDVLRSRSHGIAFETGGVVMVLAFYHIGADTSCAPPRYWSKRGVPHEKPLFFLGNMKGLGYTCHGTEINRRVYKKFKDSSPIAGFYTFLTKAVIVMDLDLIKNVLIKDFQYFSDRGLFHNERDDPLTGNLLFLDGDAWRMLRQKMSAVFTSGKVKFMLSSIVKVAEKLEQACDIIVNNGSNQVEVEDLCARFTTDVIGTCAFGIECNSLGEPRAEFREMGRKIFEQPRHSLLVQSFMICNPDLARRLRLKAFRNDTSKFFMSVVKETIKHRRESQIKRNDFVDLLIELMEKREKLLKQGQRIEKDDMASGLTFEQACAQAMVFFVAGFDTSSATMSFCLYELALNPDIQRKLREEILAVLEKYNSQITYESLKEMTYMEQNLCPNIRLPNSNLILATGLRIIIPIDAVQNDPEYFKESKQINPDRIMEDGGSGTIAQSKKRNIKASQ